MMRSFSLHLFLCILGFAVFGICNGGGLRMNFYGYSCPQAEDIVRNITQARVAANPNLAAKLLRLHYHDCFVRGCDASILLNSTATNKAEKDAGPNLSLAGYDVIDEAKAKLEQTCPGVVSCADILALASRDSVSVQFNKSMWDVLTGRKDGTISQASEITGNLPSPFSNFTTLQKNFASKKLNVADLVVLSGAHTIGISHCTLVNKRLFNFTGKGDADPSLNSTYAASLRTTCSSTPGAALDMDPGSPLSFDSHFFIILNQNQGLFQSDAALLTDKGSSQIAKQLQDPAKFLQQFSKSVQKMGAIGILTGNTGNIRKQCSVLNASV